MVDIDATSRFVIVLGEAEVDQLQQVLLHRELGMDLQSIKAIVTSPSFDRAKA